MSKRDLTLEDGNRATAELAAPWGGQLTEFVPRRPNPGIVRGLAAALAISGFPYAIIAFFLPPFWPGFAVWGGWCAIAFGFQSPHSTWFWSSSALWNLGVIAFLSSPRMNPFSLPFIHSFTSMTVSLAMVVLLIMTKPCR